MKNKSLINLVRWFCRHLTFNDLASVVPVLQEVLSGARKMELKAPEDRPPHYRQFRVDPTLPLTEPPTPEAEVADWQQIQKQYEAKQGRRITIVRRRRGAAVPPEKCRCQHCNAPARYLYMNNGKLSSQVLCKICGRTSPTDRPRRESKACYWCPHCNAALYRWKEDGICTAYKCPNDKCPFYVQNLAALTPEERGIRATGNTSQFKLRYLFREYHFASEKLRVARPEQTPVDLNRIHNNLSSTRGAKPAFALLQSTYGPPDNPKCHNAQLVTDGLPSYTSAIAAYNNEAAKHDTQLRLDKRTVIGLQNLDPESEQFRPFKQLVERLNRTYKFHTRPRAGFKNFDGVVALTTLFVAFYNHMRPHGRLKATPPVPLKCLQGQTLYPNMWIEMLRQAA